MGRRKKGREISGWLVVDKPSGLSSNAVVGRVRRALDAKKAGHAGTLDPDATGVLAVALGEATKTVPFVTDALKAYDFSVKLGEETNTDDAEGEVTSRSDIRPETDEIEASLARFRGAIQQVPPAFSAVKIDGERAYAKARAGGEVTIEARPLWVETLEIVDRPDPDHVTLHMVCGKGGYVRSIARDLGRSLGCLGHVVSLRRIWSGPFHVEDAVSLERIDALSGTAEIDALLLPLEVALQDLPEAMCSGLSADRLRHGNPGEVLRTGAEYGDTAWASHEGKAVAVGTYRSGMLHPSRVFNQ